MIDTLQLIVGRILGFAFLVWLFIGLFRIGGSNLGEAIHDD